MIDASGVRRILLAALLALPALAHAQAKVGDRFGDWVFQCVALAEGKTACALDYTLVSRPDNRPVLRLSLGRNWKGEGVVLTAIMPLGIWLPAGASGTVDQGKPFAFTLETCLQQRCIGTYPVSGEFLKALRDGKQLSVSFTLSGERKRVTLDASLAGLADGLKAARIE